MLRYLITAAITALLSAGLPAWAEVGSKDLQVAAKSLRFTVPPFTGTLKLAIVFDAGSGESQRDAESLKTILGTGLPINELTLVPVMVPISQLDSGLSGTNAVFVTGGLAGHHDRIFAATKALKLLSISSDTSCVETARCVLGVKTQPKVQILVSRSAAEASAVSFSPVFRMMISEL